MTVRPMRWATAVVLLIVFGDVVRGGWEAFSFALAERAAARASGPEALAGFFASPLVGVRARRDAIALTESDDAAARRAALEGLAGDAPLSTGLWLDLAVARLDSGAGAASAASALEMSAIVGPNEGQAMADRAAFGLALWGGMTASQRRRTFSDLVGGWDSFDETQRWAATVSLKRAPSEERADVEGALRRAGPQGVKIAERLGLSAGVPHGRDD